MSSPLVVCQNKASSPSTCAQGRGPPQSNDEVTLTGQDLEDGGEEEASALDQSEQLIQEGDEGEEAEQDGQHHESLHCLDPVWEDTGNATVVYKHQQTNTPESGHRKCLVFHIIKVNVRVTTLCHKEK